jgi:hypothetical protein
VQSGKDFQDFFCMNLTANKNKTSATYFSHHIFVLVLLKAGTELERVTKTKTLNGNTKIEPTFFN